jgi:DNA-binding transcriptional ArsR family regulator
MERRPATAEEARALANPLRLRILRLCLDRALTNKELASRLGRDPGTILHHVRMLVATGFLAADEDRRGARGAIERPYRATGKSWTLDVGDSAPGMLASVDAFREELGEGTPSDIRTMSRLGIRLAPDRLAAFQERIESLVEDLFAADDPAGEPYGFFVALHRRREDDPVVTQGRPRRRTSG